MLKIPKYRCPTITALKSQLYNKDRFLDKLPTKYEPTKREGQNSIAESDLFKVNCPTNQHKIILPTRVESNSQKLPVTKEESVESSQLPYDIFNIQIAEENELDIGVTFGLPRQQQCKKIIEQSYIQAVRPVLRLPKVGMKIRLSTDVPVYVPPRRLSYSAKKSARSIVNGLIDEGIVRPSNSEYAAPIVLVKKKNGEHRMCIDYRALNKISVKDNFPLPLLDDCIEFLGGKNCFSVLDLKNGFHQLPMDKESIKYTDFVTPFGQYEYTCMPFGLKNGPSAFQRWLTSIFRDMIDAGELIIYIDDILIATHCVDTHLRILKKLLTRLIEHGLQLKLSKCHLLRHKLTTWGILLTKKGFAQIPHT